MYYPLSQITPNQSATSGEFILSSNGEDYIGNYFSTSNGEYYTGNTPQDGPNEKLILSTTQYKTNLSDAELGLNLETSENRTTETIATTRYINSLSTPLNTAIPPASSITLPTDEEYKTGEFVRYFLKKTNTPLYIEVNIETYTNYLNENPNTQYQLYLPIKINWDLTGNPLDTYKVNRNIVLLTEKKQNIFGFEFSFRGKFVKYYKPTSQNYFNTKGGELKVETTSENYAGFYHVNPNRGIIMEGKFHKPTLHNTLIPFKGDEIVGKIKVGIDNEVGTSRRKNY
jgi:hypothetical protein